MNSNLPVGYPGCHSHMAVHAASLHSKVLLQNMGGCMCQRPSMHAALHLTEADAQKGSWCDSEEARPCQHHISVVGEAASATLQRARQTS